MADDSWTETGITWSNMPQGYVSMDTQYLTQSGWQQFNVDPAVMTDNFLSLVLKFSNEGDWATLFYSKEYS